MKNIKIFIAGAKDLTDQRSSLKLIANDLNTEYAHAGIHINLISYENYGDNQTAYNRFITKEADIVLFILDGRIGIKTEEEFLLATRNLAEHGHPEMYIFLKKFDEKNKSPEIAHIEGLLKGASDKYYILYGDEEELKDLVKDRIRRFLNKRKIRRVRRIKSFVRANIFVLTTVLLCALITFGMYKYATRLQPVLLIAGGGSAKNYIERRLLNGQALKQMDNSIYVHMPTGDSWQLLTEEVISPQNGEYKYYPISISAAEAADTIFVGNKNDDKIKNAKNFKEIGVVICVELGFDTLSIKVPNYDIFKNNIKFFDSKDITTENIKSLLANCGDSIVVYATSDKSGTRMAYQKCLNSINIDVEDYIKGRLTDEMESVQGENPLLLGSRYYMPTQLMDTLVNPYREFYVKDGNEYVRKPIYVYFMAYANKNTEVSDVLGEEASVRKVFWIPRNTIDFIEKLNIEPKYKREILSKIGKGVIRIHNENETKIIFKMNEISSAASNNAGDN